MNFSSKGFLIYSYKIVGRFRICPKRGLLNEFISAVFGIKRFDLTFCKT